MRTRIATLSLLLLAGACASANPRPAENAPTQRPPTHSLPPPVRPATSAPVAPPSAPPVSSDPGVRTLQQPALGGLIAETEPRAPTASAMPARGPTTSMPRPEPVPRPTPASDRDGLGAPPAGPLPPIPGTR